MRLARTIVTGLGFALCFAAADLAAQSLRDAPKPAEYPPSSYKGTQYVDSRGCVFIRAGFDGYVTWVPRVTRQRKQLCGYQPTAVAGTTPTAPRRPTGPEILIEPETAAATPAPQVRKPAPAPAPRQTATVRQTAPVTVTPRRTSTPTTVRTRQSTLYDPPAAADGYTRRVVMPPSGAPILSGQSQRTGEEQTFPPNTRVLPLHVWQERQKSLDVPIPKGYERIWTDDRLNPRRAEKSLASAVIQPVTKPPKGYEPTWDDDRLNRFRGPRVEAQAAATDRIWSDTVPRRLVAPVTTPPVIRAEAETSDILLPLDDAGQPFPEFNKR